MHALLTYLLLFLSYAALLENRGHSTLMNCIWGRGGQELVSLVVSLCRKWFVHVWKGKLSIFVRLYRSRRYYIHNRRTMLLEEY